MRFPVNIAKFLRTAFSVDSDLILDGLKSNISNANVNKNRKELFLYFHNSHTNEAKTTKKIWLFSYIVNIN